MTRQRVMNGAIQSRLVSVDLRKLQTAAEQNARCVWAKECPELSMCCCSCCAGSPPPPSPCRSSLVLSCPVLSFPVLSLSWSSCPAIQSRPSSRWFKARELRAVDGACNVTCAARKFEPKPQPSSTGVWGVGAWSLLTRDYGHRCACREGE